MKTYFYRYCRNLALTVAVSAGMIGFSGSALANGTSRSTIRSAQQQLQSNGYYHGKIDGVDGPMTRAAIRKYQHDNNLAVNGRLDNETRNQLGVGITGEASRSANGNMQNNNGTNPNNPNANTGSNGSYNNPNSATSSSNTNMNMNMNSASTVRAAQRKLEQQGFYKGAVNGSMGSETQAAVREFQKSNNLNVTGQLDAATLSSLGVTK